MSDAEKLDKILTKLESFDIRSLIEKLSSIEKLLIRHDEVMKNHESKFSDIIPRLHEVERREAQLSDILRQQQRAHEDHEKQAEQIRDLEKTQTKHGVVFGIVQTLIVAGAIAWAKLDGV